MADEAGGLARQQGAAGASGQDAVQEMHDENKLGEELMEVFEEFIEDKEGEKAKEKKKTAKDVLKDAKSFKTWIVNQIQQNAEAMGANAQVVGSASKPSIPPPQQNMIKELRGVLTGKGGGGNEWLSRSLATEMFSVMWDLIPILSQIKISETKLENMMMAMQFEMTMKQAEAQLEKAELQARDLEMQALKSFIQAGMTAGMMVVQAARKLQSTTMSSGKSMGETLKNKAQVKERIGKTWNTAKDMRATYRENRGVTNKEPAKATGKSGTAQEQAEGKKAGLKAFGSEMKDAGKTAWNDRMDKWSGKDKAGETEKERLQTRKENLETRKERNAEKAERKGKEREKSQNEERFFQSTEQILTNMASGIVDLARANNQRLIGIQEYNITLLQQIRENLGKARDSARQQKQEAAELIAAVLQMAAKYIDMQAQAFRITR